MQLTSSWVHFVHKTINCKIIFSFRYQTDATVKSLKITEVTRSIFHTVHVSFWASTLRYFNVWYDRPLSLEKCARLDRISQCDSLFPRNGCVWQPSVRVLSWMKRVSTTSLWLWGWSGAANSVPINYMTSKKAHKGGINYIPSENCDYYDH